VVYFVLAPQAYASIPITSYFPSPPLSEDIPIFTSALLI
jgi:hypothetical protein